MGIQPLDFFNILARNNIDFFTGVPDSILKEFCLCIDDKVPKDRHVIAANEGNAIALAAGYYLATSRLPLVYMQNSGFGNAINPILSLCDSEVYSIPVLILMGWRGEPGVLDEPQHIKQGKVQIDLLNATDIPFEIISKNEKNIEKKLICGIHKALGENKPFVLLVKKGSFESYRVTPPCLVEKLMTREEALETILSLLPKDIILVSTTGKTSREIFEIRERNNEPHYKDFLIVGSMGHCSSVALGIALAKPNRKVICIDGDGSLIMHMGNLSTVGKLKPSNFLHVLINNKVHESVGGQETSAKYIDIPNIVKSNGYQKITSVKNSSQLKNEFIEFIKSEGPSFLEVKVKPGSRTDLGRSTINPIDNKRVFMDYIKC